MCRTAAIACALLLTACASSRSEKIQFSELFPPAPEETPVGPELPVVKVTRKERQLRLATLRSRALRRALETFRARGQQYRTGAKGQSFPAQAMKNWLAALDAVDAFAQTPAHRDRAAELRLVQRVLELELELDVRTLVGFPPALAQGANERLGQLALQLAELQEGVPEADGYAGTAREGSYQWPIQPVAVTSLFGRRLHPIKGQFRLHFGVDLKAAQGQPVTAAAAGRVVRAAWNGGHGNQVELLHPGGVVTRYSHLARLAVREGMEVAQGEVIGAAGNTGQATGTHLHFEFWRRGQVKDPVEELSTRRSRERVAALQ